MDIKERFFRFIEFKQLSKRAFQDSIGVSNSYIQNIANSIGAEVLAKINKVYPELNTEWLLSGEGEMLKHGYNSVVNGNGSTSVAGNGNQVTNTDIAGLIELQKGYQEMLKKKDEQIDRLLTIIERSSIK